MRTTSQRATPMRWWMLLILSLGFVAFTLNWFDVAAAFPALGQQFQLQIPQLALLISLFIAGYGIFHIPTGFLTYRFGLRNVLLAGLLIEALGAIASAFAPSYAWLGILRIITGIGGSLFVGCGFSLVTSWFRGRELALAMGIATGGAFTLGVALGLFVWVSVVQASGWSIVLAIGGAIGLLAFLVSLIFLRVPSYTFFLTRSALGAEGEFSFYSCRTSTGTRLWRTTSWATFPKTQRFSPVSPLLQMTIKSTCSKRASE